ncbi:Amidinotransferase family-containing protein [Strongyloides ratti]|uniref:Amidinotransferase family-containing protein n=1 Tax=Strongyloides ratti TaxID=34506 RepID=A0A090LPC1_STRRB|nr:Amidinotransferase family-containing protein [Strongyloides ratti]CEF71606.1 Amidinotransferase family-containing protein [Strongyloides ratti]
MKSVGSIIQKVLMVPPTHFCVEYSINPWMGGIVDKNKAMEQWNNLKNLIEIEGVKVLTLEQVEGLPDMVFSCNFGLVYKNKVFISKFRHSQRKGEEKYFKKWFMDNNYEIIGDSSDDTFEGGGDAFFSDYQTLWGGYGERTDENVYNNISQLGINEFEIIKCQLVHPLYYHMDTCMSPYSETACLWYPPAFSIESQEKIKKKLPDSIEVDDEEAKKFICNSICIRNTIISPIGMKQLTKNKLMKQGYNVKEIDMSEFMKSGGACQCLVLKL